MPPSVSSVTDIMTSPSSAQEGKHTCNGHHRGQAWLSRPQNISLLVGSFFIGLLIGFILKNVILHKCKKRRSNHRNGARTSRAQCRITHEIVSDSFPKFRSYLYGLSPDSGIYGTQDNYLTDDERNLLGLGKVLKHASVQTEGQKVLTRCDQVEEGDVYDYAMTYVIYQNFNPKMMNTHGKSMCKAPSDYTNVRMKPDRRCLQSVEEEYDDVIHKQTAKLDIESEEDNYVDPKQINSKRPRKKKSKRKTTEHSSDSESEKELVDNKLKEYARSLRCKRSTKRRAELNMLVKKSQSVPLDAPKPRKPKSLRKNGKYMRMKLTPELWEILRHHAQILGNREQKGHRGDNTSEENLCLERGANDEESETSSGSYDEAEDAEVCYIDLTLGK